MSGHSKWANIKHRKGKSDAARGKIFTKLGREIAVSVKQGGSDPLTNSKLSDIIAKAKACNMPNDNISRSIKKASGELGAVNYEALTYEGYGVGGSAVIVSVLTDNKNRTAGEIRHCFDKYGNGMGSTGCVAYNFESKGVIVIERTADLDEDKIMELALEAEADDVVIEEDIAEILTQPTKFSEVRKFFEAKNINLLQAEIEMVAKDLIDLDEANVPKFKRLIEEFDELDDVQTTYHNVNLPEDEDEE